MSSRLFDHLKTRIRHLREQRGLTQEAFAEDAAISYKYYQAIEAGRKMDLRLSTLERLARAHGVEVWELLLPEMKMAAVAEDRTPVKPARRSKPKKSPAARGIAARKNR